MLIVQFYHKMALAKNLHELKTNLVNIYRVQKGCGTKIKGLWLHTFLSSSVDCAALSQNGSSKKSA